MHVKNPLGKEEWPRVGGGVGTNIGLEKILSERDEGQNVPSPLFHVRIRTAPICSVTENLCKVK